MFDTFRDHKRFPRCEIYGAVFQINQETTADHVKEFVFVVVMMPMILAFHDT